MKGIAISCARSASRSVTHGAVLNSGPPVPDNIILQAASRSDRTLVSGETTLPILLPHLRVQNSSTAFVYYGKVGQPSTYFDILTNDISLCGWVLIPTGTVVTENGSFLFGKIGKSTVVSGHYGFRADHVTGCFESKITSSTGANLITSEVAAVGTGWHFLRMSINNTTKKHSFWVDEVLIASNDFTGTFTSPAEIHGFFIGAGTISGSTVFGTIAACFSDVYFYKRLLTDPEGALLRAGTPVSGAAFHCACNEYNFNDLSGNGYHMAINLTADVPNSLQIDYRFGEGGSKQGLNLGYSEYIDLKGNKIHIPYADNGEAMATPSIPAGATLVKNVAGISDLHNLFDSCIELDTAIWDRSDTDSYNLQARLTGRQYATSGNDRSGETYYIPTRPKAWHISELNQQVIYNYLIDANNTNESDKFVKVDVNSILDRQKLTEIIAYSSALSEDDSDKALAYTKDKTIINNHSLSYEIIETQISAKRGLKILYFVETTNTLSLSIDGGATILRSLEVAALANFVGFAHIFENGNILFASQTKCYLSTDNLQTAAETTVLDVAGSAYVAGDMANFMPFSKDKNLPDTLPLIWGNYRNTPSTAPASIWYTADQGATVKQAFKFGTSQIGGNTISVQHVHSVTYNSFDESFYICTGDDATGCYFLKGVYDSDLDTWAFTIAAQSADTGAFKGCNLTYYDGYFYWACDSVALTYRGIMKCAYADLGDISKTIRIYKSGAEFTSLQMTDDGKIIATGLLLGYIVTSLDRVNFKVTRLPDTYNAASTGYIIMYPDDGNGNFIAQLYPNGKNLYTITSGVVAILSIDV